MRQNMVFFIALSFLVSGQVIAQPAIAGQAEDSGTGLLILLTFCLLILVIVALWLLKNTYRLKETVENPEINGETWLKRHLRDLDMHQLNILMKRHSLVNNDVLKDEKPNE